MNDIIKYSFWLTFDSSGHVPRITKNAPGVTVGERSMQCNVELPRAVFKQPQLVASIKVEREQTESLSIDIEAAETALAGVVGCDVLMTVSHPEEDDRDAPA